MCPLLEPGMWVLPPRLWELRLWLPRKGGRRKGSGYLVCPWGTQDPKGLSDLPKWARLEPGLKYGLSSSYPVGSFTCAPVVLSDRRPSRISCCLRAFEEPAFQASPVPKHNSSAHLLFEHLLETGHCLLGAWGPPHFQTHSIIYRVPALCRALEQAHGVDVRASLHP